MSVMECPNCHQSTSTSGGKCEHCGASISTGGKRAIGLGTMWGNIAVAVAIVVIVIAVIASIYSTGARQPQTHGTPDPSAPTEPLPGESKSGGFENGRTEINGLKFVEFEVRMSRLCGWQRETGSTGFRREM